MILLAHDKHGELCMIMILFKYYNSRNILHARLRKTVMRVKLRQTKEEI